MANRRSTSSTRDPRGSADPQARKKGGAENKSKPAPSARHSAELCDNNHGNGAPANQPPQPKTNFSIEELEIFKERLIQKRRQLVGDMEHMSDEALGNNRTAAAGDLSMMPIHMADIGTDNYEQEFTIGLIENNRELLKEIDAALQRIEDRSYGLCLATRRQVSKARLMAKPWAKYCIQYKRASEKHKQR